ncbi:MAG: hypothetical protein MJ250_07555 [Alphaproteobacteria bacterium]|nr:hypothetical protein [Alphaproteobacteria bacterium]
MFSVEFFVGLFIGLLIIPQKIYLSHKQKKFQNLTKDYNKLADQYNSLLDSCKKIQHNNDNIKDLGKQLSHEIWSLANFLNQYQEYVEKNKIKDLQPLNDQVIKYVKQSKFLKVIKEKS